MTTRDELVGAVSERYGRASRVERGHILDEFAAVTGLHRKHAVRLLRNGTPSRQCGPRPGRRVYDVAVREALIVVWEASDRVCGKRLRPLVPLLIDAMERHGHLQLAPEVRGGLLAMSAATTPGVSGAFLDEATRPAIRAVALHAPAPKCNASSCRIRRMDSLCVGIPPLHRLRWQHWKPGHH